MSFDTRFGVKTSATERHPLRGVLRVPEAEQARLVERMEKRCKRIDFWSRVFPETPAFLDSLRARGYCLGVISNSLGWIEEQLGRVGVGHEARSPK